MSDPKLRIVCTDCPAVAVVHHQERDEVGRSMVVWLECHGEHRWGFVSDSQTEDGRTATFQDVHRLSPAYDHEAYNRTLVRLVTGLEVRLRYIRATGYEPSSAWSTPDEAYETCERLSVQFATMAQKYRDGVLT